MFHVIILVMLSTKKYLPKDVSESIDSFLNNNKFIRPITEINNLNEVFIKLAEGVSNGLLDETIIGDYIFNNLTSSEVRTRKSSAYDFEEIMCELLGGTRVEEIPEGQLTRHTSSFSDEEIKRRVERNILEKGDILAGDKCYTIKTLIPATAEINAGSFSSEALLKDFITPIPQERQELGSRPLLNDKFSKIHDNGLWPEFTDRFKIMVNEIYHSDWVLGIKDDRRLIVYTMESQDFISLLNSYFDEEWDKPTEFVNRFEAHALRIKTKVFCENADKIEIDLFGPGSHIVESIDRIILSIRSSLVKFARMCTK